MSKNAIYDTISVLIVCAVIGGIAMTMIFNLTSIPDVHVSHSTNECVKVINYTEELFSCENMPTKYNHVWVK